MALPSHLRILLLTCLSCILLKSCYKESILEESGPWIIPDRVLEFDGTFAFCDREDHVLLYTLPSDTVYAYAPLVSFGEYESLEFDGMKLNDKQVNMLGQVVINHPYAVKARKGSREESFMLYFTSLPLIHIHTKSEIMDEPKILSWTELTYRDTKQITGGPRLYTGYAGIEIRGRTSAGHEKKSYGLELWENSLEKDVSAPLLGMREGEDWILDAMFVDPLRMRNKLSFELWEKMWKNQSNIPFQTANPGIQGEFVELFINQRYMGLYCLTERLDEKLIHLEDVPGGRGSVLYKAIDWSGGSTSFTTYNSEPGQSFIWEGWEQIYPDDLYYWGPLAEIRKSVVNDSDEIFEERIDTLLNLEVAAAYYLFTNLILAHDNIIKNYFLARYPEESSFLLLPWDLEGSWGIMWDGDPSSSSGLLGNRLYTRLKELDVEDFNDRLEYGWEKYRASIFTQDSLTASFFREADFLRRSGAFERENMRWAAGQINLDQELEYFRQWTELRLEYLDLVFD